MEGNVGRQCIGIRVYCKAFDSIREAATGEGLLVIEGVLIVTEDR